MQPILSAELLGNLKKESLFLLDQIDGIARQTPVELLETNDGPGRWNTLQVLEHLNTYYRYYIPVIAQQLDRSGSAPKKSFTPGWLGNYFTKAMLPKAGKVTNKMKAMKGHSPNAQLDASLVLKEFLDWQRKLVELLTRAEQADLNRIKIPITLSRYIKLKLGDVFRFIVAHNQRHFVQIENLLGRFHLQVA